MILLNEVYYIKDAQGQYLKNFTVNAGVVHKLFTNLKTDARAFINLVTAEEFNSRPELGETIVRNQVTIDLDNLEEPFPESGDTWCILDSEEMLLQVFALSEGMMTKTFTQDYTIRRKFTTLETAETLNAHPLLQENVGRVTEGVDEIVV